MRRWTLTLLLTTGLGAQVSLPGFSAQRLMPGLGLPVILTPPITLVVMIAPAESVSGDRGVDLSEAGRARARHWALSLSLYRPRALYAATEPITRATLLPTADHLGLDPKACDIRDLKGLAREIRNDHAGDSVVVCWPAKHMKPLALALGVPEPLAEWPPAVADQIWVIWFDARGVGAIETAPQSAPPDPAGPSRNAAVWGVTR